MACAACYVLQDCPRNEPHCAGFFAVLYFEEADENRMALQTAGERDGRCLCIQVCRVRIYFLGDRHAYRIDLGVPVMGQVLGLGPGGDMVADYLGVFRALPAPQEVLWVVRGTGRLFLFSLLFTLTSFCVFYATY